MTAPMTGDLEEHEYDVLIIGAGGAGPARRDRRPRGGTAHGHHLQVPVRQGAHGDGRGRHRREHGQRQQQRQLAGALPRHHARRQVPQLLADGRAARQGGARPGLGAGDLRRPVRPHAGRPDQPAQLRRPRVPPARPRRRPHRARADPHHAAEDRLAAAGRRAASPATADEPAQGLRRGDDHRPAPGPERAPSPARSATGASRAGSCASTPRPSSSPPAASASRSRSPRTRGSTPATVTPWPCAPGPRWSTWSSSSSTRPAWSGRPRSRASSSPSRCAATAAS